jgi:hydroxycarboxylate dehydrogenase B
MLVDRKSALEFVTEVFMFFRASRENASIVAFHLVESSEMGLSSHGVIRVPQYVAEIERGEIQPDATPSTVLEEGGRIAIDGNHGFGQVAGMVMARKAAELAERHGVAVVTGCKFGHTGRIGAYAELIARRGIFGLVASGGSRSTSGNWVAPFGGKEGRLSTNPLAYAFPVAEGDPVAADFATSTAPEGVIRSLRNRGLQAPPGTLRDADGHPTTDPGVLYAKPHGVIEPLGGQYYGHKGTAIAILPAVLALLTADQPGWTPEDGGMAILAIRGGRGFAKETGWMADYIRACPPLDAARPVMMPGDRERAVAAASRGIDIDPPTWDALEQLARRAKIATPTVVAV